MTTQQDIDLHNELEAIDVEEDVGVLTSEEAEGQRQKAREAYAKATAINEASPQPDGEEHPGLNLPTIVPYGVLGEVLVRGDKEQRAPQPGEDITITDPAGVDNIQPPGGPHLAGGAAGAIYDFLGLTAQPYPRFPEEVIAAVTKDGDAKLATYTPFGEVKTCIHTVGPNFNDSWARTQPREWAVEALAVAYENTLREYATSSVPTLRLLPISGAIFAGKWINDMPEMTVEAWNASIARLKPDEVTTLRERRLEMCIYDERDIAPYLSAFEQAQPDESTCFPVAQLTIRVPASQHGGAQALDFRVKQGTTTRELKQQVARRGNLDFGEIRALEVRFGGEAGEWETLPEDSRIGEWAGKDYGGPFALGLEDWVQSIGGIVNAQVDETMMLRRMQREEVERSQLSRMMAAEGGIDPALMAQLMGQVNHGPPMGASSGPSPEKVAQLTSMGFTQEQAEDALASADGDIDIAVTLLIG